MDFFLFLNERFIFYMKIKYTFKNPKMNHARMYFRNVSENYNIGLRVQVFS